MPRASNTANGGDFQFVFLPIVTSPCLYSAPAVRLPLKVPQVWLVIGADMTKQYDGAVIISTKIDQAEYEKGLANMRKATQDFAKSATSGFDSVSKSTLGLADALKIGAAAFAGFGLSSFIKNAALAAARYETLGTVAITAGRNVGKSAEQVAQYEQALRDTGIAATEARQSIAAMAAAGIDLDFSDKIARAAQDLAVVGGINSSDAFTRMIRGIQSGEQEILKTMGLNVQWEESYKDLARQLGKTSDALSSQEKVQARLNAVLKQSAAYTGIYEASMETAGKQLGSLDRHLSDLSVKIGSVALDALSYGVSGFTETLKSANAQLDEWGKSGDLAATGKAIGDGFRFATEHIDKAVAALVAYQTITKFLMPLQQQLAYQTKLFGMASESAGKLNLAMGTMRGVAQGLKASLSGIVNALGGPVALGFTAVATGAYAIATAQSAGASEAEKYGLSLDSVLDKYRRLSSEAGNAAEDAKRLSDAQRAAAQANFEQTQKELSALREKVALQAQAYMQAKESRGGAYRSEVSFTEGFDSSEINGLYEVFKGLRDESNNFADANKQTLISLVEIRDAAEKIQKADPYSKAGEEAQAYVSWLDVLIPKLERIVDLNSSAVSSSSAFVIPDSQLEMAKHADAISKAREETNKLFASTEEGTRKQLELAAATAKENHELLRTAESAAVLRQAQEKLHEFNKKTRESAGSLAEAFAKLGKSSEEMTPENAIRYLQNIIKNSDAAKKSAVELQKAEAGKAVQFLKTAADANEYSASLAQVEAHEAKLAGNDALYRALMARSEALRASAKAARDLASSGEEAISAPDFGKISGSGSGETASQFIKRYQEEIDKLKGGGGATYVSELAAAIKKLSEEGKKAGVAASAIKALGEQYKQAFAANKVREFNDELARLEGKGSEVAMRQLAERAEDFKQALIGTGKSAEEAEVLVKRLTDATKRDAEIDNLENKIQLMQRVSELAGAYGLGIEEQNRLIELQAQKYRDLFANEPAMQRFVDLWEQLTKREASDSWGDGFSRSADKWAAEWTNSAKVAEKQFGVLAGAIEDLGSHAVDAVFGDAEFRADQFFKDIAKQMLKIAMNQMIGNIFGMFFGNIGKTFSQGGYTGDGPVSEISGAVHNQEYVMPAKATKSIGIEALNYMRATGSIPPYSGNRTQQVNNSPQPIVYSPNVNLEYTAAAGSDSTADAQKMLEMLNKGLERSFNEIIDKRLVNNMRPGGILAPSMGRGY